MSMLLPPCHISEQVKSLEAGTLLVVATTTKTSIGVAGEGFSSPTLLASNLVFDGLELRGSDFAAEYFYMGAFTCVNGGVQVCREKVDFVYILGTRARTPSGRGWFASKTLRTL